MSAKTDDRGRQRKAIKWYHNWWSVFGNVTQVDESEPAGSGRYQHEAACRKNGGIARVEQK